MDRARTWMDRHRDGCWTAPPPVYGIDWSSDGRNLLLRGTTGAGVTERFSFPTLGERARCVAPQGAGFWRLEFLRLSATSAGPGGRR